MTKKEGYFAEYKEEIYFNNSWTIAWLSVAPDKSYHLYIINSSYPQGFTFKAKDPNTDLLPFLKEAKNAIELYSIGVELLNDGVAVSCQPYAPHLGLGF